MGENYAIRIQVVVVGSIQKTLYALILSTNHQDKNWKDLFKIINIHVA